MTTYNADVEALQMLTALTNGLDFTIPKVDMSGPEYQIPYDPESQKPQAPLTNASLTSGKVGGNGTFDVLMCGIVAHLQVEYKAGRITGAEYTKAYIAMVEAAIQGSVQYLVQRDGAYWQAMQAQAQSVTARVQLVTAKAELANTQYSALNAKAGYALTVAKLADESVGYGTAKYNIEYMMPQQLQAATNQGKMLGEQMEAQRAQTLDVRSDGQVVTGVLGKQKTLYDQQSTSYKRDSEVKAAKLFTDSWITQKTVDDGLLPPQGFTNGSIDTILTALKTNNGFN